MKLHAIFDSDCKEMLWSQVFSVGGGLLVGMVLAAYTNKLFLIPAMLILIPGFFELRGNISSSLTSRISSGLFLGVIPKKKILTRIIHENIIATFFLSLILSALLGIIAAATNYFIFGIFDLRIIFISTIAGVLANTIDIPIAIFSTFYLFNKGHDPNNIMGPLITTVSDIVSILVLLVALVVVA